MYVWYSVMLQEARARDLLREAQEARLARRDLLAAEEPRTAIRRTSLWMGRRRFA